MKVQILQGINLENPITTIKVTTDGEPKVELLELIKSFHPLFLADYSTKANTISIQSKLPHLWREIAVALNNQSTGQWSYEYAKKYALEVVIGNQIKSMSTIPILHSAHEMGYETIQFYLDSGIVAGFGNKKYNRYYSIGVGSESSIAISSASSKDAYIAQNSQRDKWLTNTVITRLGLPTARWRLITSQEDIKEEFESYEKPIVIKPTGMTGGNGVVTNINTLEEAYKAFKYAKDMIEQKDRPAWQQKIMMQEQVEGEDYRLLVINGKLEIATKRIPAFVTGDGVKNIEELIVETNKDPRRDIENPAHTLKPIKIDTQMDQFLKQQNLDIKHVPPKDKRIYVRKVASMSQGGITEDFTDKVHPQIKYVVESLSKSIRGHVVGVDLLCKDVSKPLTKENGIIVECNTMPEAYLNTFPVIGKQRPEIGKVLVESLVDISKPTKKIVVLGGKRESIDTILKLRLNNIEQERVGTYSENNIYINGEVLTQGIENWKALEALKLNASLTTIVFHYENSDEIKEIGLGFDNIDTLYISKEFAQKNEDILKILDGYKTLGILSTIETI